MTMTNGLPVLDTADDVTPEWLTQVLLSAGHTGAQVAGVTVAPVGTGQMADSSRISITYGGAPAADFPASLVGKFPSTDPQSRSAGERGGYAREVAFYQHMAHRVSGRTPSCYFAEVGKPDEFTLILEDMAPAAQGDQLGGCSIEQAEAALVNLAGFHGPVWNDPSLGDSPIGARSEGNVLAEFMAAFTPEFNSRYAARLSDDDKALATEFAARVVEWDQFETGSVSLIHGDYRLDNLLFATTKSCPPVTTVDWQTLRTGPPLRDAAYFLGTSLDPEIRARHEEALVEVYHQALLTHGVVNYSLEQCWDAYRLGSLQGPLITILGSIGVKQTDRGDDMFMTMMRRSGQQARDLGALSLF